MEEGEKKERRRKGIELGGKKVYTLAYTDNVVLLANNEGEMRSMMGRLEEYLKSKRSMLTTKKKKVRKSKSVAVYRWYKEVKSKEIPRYLKKEVERE